MRKQEEVTNPTSCLNNAHPAEMLFVLLGRDPAAPIAIRAWCEARVRLSKNVQDDPQIQDALRCAMIMEQEHHFVRDHARRSA